MANQYCPECGKENPADARYCMACGLALDDDGRSQQIIGVSTTRANGSPIGGRAAGAAPAGESGTDWAEIAAAALAFLGLRHLSRKGRQTAIAITFLVLFFGCPMVCGFAMFLVESFAALFQ